MPQPFQSSHGIERAIILPQAYLLHFRELPSAALIAYSDISDTSCQDTAVIELLQLRLNRGP
jgi:hypothetical protein